MTEISLRAYCDEVEELIRTDSHDQAIAICQHILRIYPKYLEAYRLLGQVCVEKGMHSEAEDFFSRVLSADPEDFIAHVGLSIISEERDLDEAIWQMERAFELASDNAEVRKGLRRLYARRDKVEKPRLKPTRGGLGRFYARGGHLQQAIEEFKGVLEEDEGRVDIQVALAEVLWRKGQRLEASELCVNILEKLPNCLKANLIWGEVWFHSDNEELKEEAAARLAIAQALDPENTVAQELFGHLSPLSPQVKEIPRLEYVAVAPEEAVEELPPVVAPTEIIPEFEEALDLLRQAREKAPEPMAEEPELEPMMVEPAAEVRGLAEAEEIPDWVKQLREVQPGEGIEEAPVGPQAVVEDVEEPTVVQPSEVEEEGEVPDWLQQLRGRVTEEPHPSEEMGLPMAEEEAPAGEAAVPEGEEVPTWLRVPREEEVEETAPAMELPEVPEAEAAPVEEAPPAEVAPVEEEEIPAWLRILREEGLEEPTLEEAPAEEVVAEEEVPEAEAVPVEEAPPAEVAPVEEEEIPAWLRILREEGLEEPSLEEAPAEEVAAEEEVPEAEAVPVEEVAVTEVAPVEEEEIPAWLRILREEGLEEPILEEAPAEEVVAEEEVPEAEAVPVEEAPPAEVAPVEEEEIPAWLRIMREEGLEEPSLEEAPAEEVVAEEEVPEAEVPSEAVVMAEEAPMAEELPPAEPAEEIPEWLLRVMREEGVEEPAFEEVTAEGVVAEAEVPEVEVAPVEEAPPAEVAPVEEEEIPAWLRILREEGLEEPTLEEAPAEEVVAEAEVPEVEAVPVEEAPPAEVAPAEEEEIPAWLRILREEGLEELVLEEVPAAEEVVAELEVPEVEAAPVEEAVLAEVAPVEEEEIPAWLRILREEELEEVPAAEEVVAEVEVEVPEAEAALVEEVALAEAVPVEEEEVPAWLRILRGEELEEEPVEEIVAEAVELPEVEKEEVPIAAEAVAEEVPEEAVPLKVELVEAPSTIAEYQARLEIEPKDYDTRLSLARAYHQEGDREAAIDQYGKLIRSGRLLEMVVEDLERVSREAPDQSDVWQLLGDVYAKAGHLRKALESYQEALARL